MKLAVTLPIVAAASFMSIAALIAPAQAQSSRTWVSGAGTDVAPCSRTAPCASFNFAQTQTNAGGEIDCVDAGSFGTIVITKAITIDCGSGETGSVGSISAQVTFPDVIPANNGISVQAGASDKVYLRKLTIRGGVNGIQYLSGQSVHIDNVNINNFTNNGIDMAPSAGATLDVVNSNITNCANNGIGIAAGGAGLLSVSLKGVRLSQNSNGLRAADNGSATMHVSIVESIASSNSGSGFIATTGGGRLTVLLEQTTAANNAGTGVVADGANTELHISHSHVFGNSTGLSATAGAALVSYKDNEIKLNGSNGAPTAVVSFD